MGLLAIGLDSKVILLQEIQVSMILKFQSLRLENKMGLLENMMGLLENMMDWLESMMGLLENVMDL